MTKDKYIEFANKTLERWVAEDGYIYYKANLQAIEALCKLAAAHDKLKCQCSLSTSLTGDGCQYCNPEYMDDDTLTIAYQSGYYDGKKAAQRPWVGLTAEEAAECWTTSATQTWKNFENALRNKNT